MSSEKKASEIANKISSDLCKICPPETCSKEEYKEVLELTIDALQSDLDCVNEELQHSEE